MYPPVLSTLAEELTPEVRGVLEQAIEKIKAQEAEAREKVRIHQYYLFARVCVYGWGGGGLANFGACVCHPLEQDRAVHWRYYHSFMSPSTQRTHKYIAGDGGALGPQGAAEAVHRRTGGGAGGACSHVFFIIRL